MNLLSRPEELLLLAVWRLQDQAYGAAIRTYISETTQENWSIGSVYGTLDRLARNGLVQTHMGPPTHARGGRSKRFFELTAQGVAALNRVRDIQTAMWQGLPVLNIAGAK